MLFQIRARIRNEADRWLTLGLVLVLSLWGCGGDDPAGPPFKFDPDLERLWPHADGTEWIFGLTSQECVIEDYQLYPTPEDVPALPSFETLYARLQTGVHCAEPESRTGRIEMEFNGESVLPGDVVTQRLQAYVAPRRNGPSSPWPLTQANWMMNIEGIVDLNSAGAVNDTGFVYLTRDLEPGSEFSQTLMPSFIEDLTLSARIWRHVKVRKPNEGWANAVESFYLLDFGSRAVINEVGEVIGYYPLYRYGVIQYAEDVGPMWCREHKVQPPDIVNHDRPSPTVLEVEATLTY